MEVFVDEGESVQRWSAGEVQRGRVILSRGGLMGLLPLLTDDIPVEEVLPRELDRLVHGLRRFGVATALSASAAAGHPADRGAALDVLLDATEHNPLPEGEWAPLRGRLGDELLAGLVDVAEVSLRRYASGQRPTPDAVAQRLHWLALVVADLDGSYNAFGVRRWFTRPRSVLGGRSPLAVLSGGFDPDGDQAAAVRALAGALVALGAS